MSKSVQVETLAALRDFLDIVLLSLEATPPVPLSAQTTTTLLEKLKMTSKKLKTSASTALPVQHTPSSKLASFDAYLTAQSYHGQVATTHKTPTHGALHPSYGQAAAMYQPGTTTSKSVKVHGTATYKPLAAPTHHGYAAAPTKAPAYPMDKYGQAIPAYKPAAPQQAATTSTGDIAVLLKRLEALEASNTALKTTVAELEGKLEEHVERVTAITNDQESTNEQFEDTLHALDTTVKSHTKLTQLQQSKIQTMDKTLKEHTTVLNSVKYRK
ncbi:hypothetical protein SDRG_07008 [Saprolegnia diclina VS20]|uniref:Uncharacterized protein n=1 Tax=Saprolegnia diclina (strain VS20) TaxID=1156394 RepID=T0QPD5_SAPDV|nr:hypothetical protein SDRG_07008 [Saprolegnia diclina VS20]EQC35730.1 hypothetical protein SDRG_07008 [Saprolegnia diclina VS20]|eukprot:XP_008611047.1 hypothetical protein SDRG_07008 [Saprolegnia diclina VS20]